MLHEYKPEYSYRIYPHINPHFMLTHLPLDKMAAILADNIFKCIFLNENDKILIHISLKFFPSSPIDDKQALVQVMACCWTGDKPLPEPMLTQITDAYIYVALRGDESNLYLQFVLQYFRVVLGQLVISYQIGEPHLMASNP